MMATMTAIDDMYIAATPARAFATIAAYNGMNDWFPEYQCQIIDADSISEGCLVRHRVGKKRALSQFIRRIDRIEDGQRLEESYIEGDLLGTGVWTFTAEGDGCRVAYDCTVTANTFGAKLGIWLTGAKLHNKFYQNLLTHLKAHLENA